MIRFLRTALSGCFFALYGLGSLVIGVLFFPPLMLFRAGRMMRLMVRLSWKLFVWGGKSVRLFRIEISDDDRKRLSETRGCVVVANHMTLIDVIVLSVFLPDATAIAKAAARGNFFYSLIVRNVFLVNDNPMRVIEEAKKCLSEGVNIIVFPQGTRTAAGTKRPLKRGAAQIAIHAGVPILPVVLSCDPSVLGKGQPWHDVSDRMIVWTLRVRDSIEIHSAANCGNHSAAVSLTETIRNALDL